MPEPRPYPTCRHREWTDEDNETDAAFPSGDECGAQATFLACTPLVDTPVCCRHACRCRKLIPDLPRYTAEAFDALRPSEAADG